MMGAASVPYVATWTKELAATFVLYATSQLTYLVTEMWTTLLGDWCYLNCGNWHLYMSELGKARTVNIKDHVVWLWPQLLLKRESLDLIITVLKKELHLIQTHARLQPFSSCHCEACRLMLNAGSQEGKRKDWKKHLHFNTFTWAWRKIPAEEDRAYQIQSSSKMMKDIIHIEYIFVITFYFQGQKENISI